ncbi:MAG: gamma-glutamyl-gamma-aminobutyrate hydrolase family protein [Armatimonadetes bacterium]|nr:gamma-glutamyl-gamma-aminobutyrate hydrolase family protein [Armatimonadota bacterium]MBS1728724.1 gamma-glutamyl-gamma-aminobutyrate hydrolase family protein [Armatimonadota bacterium]
MKPLIGITIEAEFDAANDRSNGKLILNWNYADQVAEAGGNPILITPMTDLEWAAKAIDGWLIPGGADMDASHFGEENHPKVEPMNPKRWEMENTMYGLVDPEMPVLGICFGCQFINVKRGGSLIQHLPDVVSHEEHSGGTMQAYELVGASKLSSFAGTARVEGKSYHHQAINRVGGGLEVVAKHDDGTIEAVEDPSKSFFVGVQWHPERTPDDFATQNLFRAFVRAAEAYSRTKP